METDSSYTNKFCVDVEPDFSLRFMETDSQFRKRSLPKNEELSSKHNKIFHDLWKTYYLVSYNKEHCILHKIWGPVFDDRCEK